VVVTRHTREPRRRLVVFVRWPHILMDTRITKVIKIAWETDNVEILEFDTRADAIIFMNAMLDLIDSILTGINAGLTDEHLKTMIYVESKGINETITDFRVGTEDERFYSYILT
jgi:hypothetical protein